MNKMKLNFRKLIATGAGILVPVLIILSWYLFKGLAHEPKPAGFACYDLKQGSLQDFTPGPGNVYGVGLAYANHIIETASNFQPGGPPPIFKKAVATVNQGGPVAIPSRKALIKAAGQFEAGLDVKLEAEFQELAALLDFETELGFVLLEDIPRDKLKGADFAPALGFFAANDLSARSLAVLGEGQSNKHDYWGVSKSFPGFLPVSAKQWIPAVHQPNGLPCVTLKTRVNGEVRQSESTANLIYTPRQMLRYIAVKYPAAELKKGDIILTGTPGGVAMATPRWLVRLGGLVGLDRFAKLNAVLGRDRTPFLKPGDKVEVEAEGIGKVTNTITAQD